MKNDLKDKRIEVNYNGKRFPISFLPGIGEIEIVNIPGKSIVKGAYISYHPTGNPIFIREVKEGSRSLFLINGICIENYISGIDGQRTG